MKHGDERGGQGQFHCGRFGSTEELHPELPKLQRRNPLGHCAAAALLTSAGAKRRLRQNKRQELAGDLEHFYFSIYWE